MPGTSCTLREPDTGKTHIATALGVQAIEHHKKHARFFSIVELVNALRQEKAPGDEVERAAVVRQHRPQQGA